MLKRRLDTDYILRWHKKVYRVMKVDLGILRSDNNFKTMWGSIKGITST